MTPLGIAVRTGRLLGLHVSPLSQHPAQTFLGLPAPDLIIDVGANIGQFAKEARRRFPYSRIVSIEPLPSAFATLAGRAKEDGNAIAINCAVGSVEATLPMNLCIDYDVSSSLLATTDVGVATYPETARQEVVDVPVRRIDDILRDAGVTVTARTLLKLDVQGFEEQALAGAPETLSRVGALLSEINIASIYEGQADFAGIYDRARSAGMYYVGNVAQNYGKDGQVVYLDALFRR